MVQAGSDATKISPQANDSTVDESDNMRGLVEIPVG